MNVWLEGCHWNIHSLQRKTRLTFSSSVSCTMLESIDIGFFISGTASNTTYEYLSDPDVIATHHVFLVVVVLYIPLITGFNTIVFWGILLYPGFYTNNNLLLLSLAFGDFLVGVYCLPMYFVSYSETTRVIVYSSRTSCLAWLTSGVLSAGGSLGSLLLIAIDRFIAVMWPLKYGVIVTAERIITTLILFWIILFITAFLPSFGLNNYNPNIQSLSICCNFYVTLPKYYVYGAILGAAAPTVVISGALYTQIIYVVWKQAKRLRLKQFSNSEQTTRLQHRIRTVQLSSFLMLAFVLMWFPYVSIAPFKYYHVFSQKSIEITKCCALMFTFGNSLINPIIYAIFREDYRKVYKVMIVTAPWKWKPTLRELYVNKHQMSVSNYYRSDVSETSRHTPGRAKLGPASFNSEISGRYSVTRKISNFSKISNKETVYFSLYNSNTPETNDLLHRLYRIVPSISSLLVSSQKGKSTVSSSSKLAEVETSTATALETKRESFDSDTYHDCLPP